MKACLSSTKALFGNYSNVLGIDVLHSRQLQNEEQGHTMEHKVDDVIRGWEQRTRVCKP